jgi:hypothetical protein
VDEAGRIDLNRADARIPLVEQACRALPLGLLPVVRSGRASDRYSGARVRA